MSTCINNFQAYLTVLKPFLTAGSIVYELHCMCSETPREDTAEQLRIYITFKYERMTKGKRVNM